MNPWHGLTDQKGELKLRRLDIINSLKISKADIVLEIGPGNMPFHRSDIYIERDLTNNVERAGDFQITKPCVLGDAHSLPFDDKSIDYIFCAQVLEHSDNPDKILKEIMRVAKRGYIETPNFYRELLFGWPFHNWVIEKEGNCKLILYKNKLPQYFGELFHRLQIEEYSGQLFFNLNFERFNTSYEWESSIDYEIRSYEELMAKYERRGNNKFYIKHNTRPNNINYEGILSLRLLMECMPFLRKHINILLKFKDTFTKDIRKTNLKVDIKTVIEKMKCTSCGGKFEDYTGKERVHCMSCANFLTIKDKILIMDIAYKGINSCK